jgi:hypothetical protein
MVPVLACGAGATGAVGAGVVVGDSVVVVPVQALELAGAVGAGIAVGSNTPVP